VSEYSFIQANTNGELHDATRPSLSPLDRSFLYGDAVYEVWRTYEGVVFAWSEHWQRLGRSAASLGMQLPLSEAALWEQVQRTALAYRDTSGFQGDLYIRLQISRGAGRIGLSTRLVEPGRGSFVILVQPVPQISALHWEHGLTLSMANNLRRNPVDALNPAWKTGNYLNNLMCLHEAQARGADDVLILNHRDELTEASTSNVAFIRGTEFITPPLKAGILEGITRQLILSEVAQRAGLIPVERVIKPEELPGFDECMLLSSTKDVQPVGCIDQQTYQVGAGSRTRQLKQAFADYVQAGVPEWSGRRLFRPKLDQ
jgi:branched-chain amino acid aminotransferase